MPGEKEEQITRLQHMIAEHEKIGRVMRELLAILTATAEPRRDRSDSVSASSSDQTWSVLV